MSVRPAAIGLAYVLAAAGCTTAAPPSPSAPGASPTPLPATAAPAPTPVLRATYEPAPSGPSNAIAVQLGTMTAARFVPDSITAKAGTITFFLTNPRNDTFPFGHDIRFGPEMFEPLAYSPVLPNRETGIFTVEDVPAGEYVLWCQFEGHFQLGMTGELTVTP
jgi:plastocyanin